MHKTIDLVDFSDIFVFFFQQFLSQHIRLINSLKKKAASFIDSGTDCLNEILLTIIVDMKWDILGTCLYK